MSKKIIDGTGVELMLGESDEALDRPIVHL